MAVMIAGQSFWLWRAVDDEGEVLDILVQRQRDRAAAVKLTRKLLKKQGFDRTFWRPTSRALAAPPGSKLGLRLAMSSACA
jgi:transposase-like protein